MSSEKNSFSYKLFIIIKYKKQFKMKYSNYSRKNNFFKGKMYGAKAPFSRSRSRSNSKNKICQLK
jgi:hypothetical protein